MRPTDYRPAKLSDDFEAIIDSDGRRVDYADQRIVHVLTDIANPLTFSLVEAVYAKHRKRCRSAGKMDNVVMQYAKQICSGRECIPMTAMTGAMVKDIRRHRLKDDIGIYFTLDQEGPCQNGAWPLVWETFCRRIEAKNIIAGVNRNTTPKHLGLTDRHLRAINDCILLGDLFEEARNALAIIAEEPDRALQLFDKAFREVAASLKSSDKSLEVLLAEWVDKMRSIPAQGRVADAPKVLIIGGLNLMFVHFPISSYLIEEGILPKVVDVAEGACWVESEDTVRHGFKSGYITPRKQFSFKPSRDDRQAALAVRKSRLGVKMIDSRLSHFRDILDASGLLFDRHHAYVDLVEAGHPYVSGNSFTETTTTTGRYLCAREDGIYDGFVNLGAFNCQPAMNSQAILRPLANSSDLPYIAIDCEGPWLSVAQRRLLETLAIRAKRNRRHSQVRGSEDQG